jgi:hypothetical protein
MSGEFLSGIELQPAAVLQRSGAFSKHPTEHFTGGPIVAVNEYNSASRIPLDWRCPKSVYNVYTSSTIANLLTIGLNTKTSLSSTISIRTPKLERALNFNAGSILVST